ncbi:unnamed protein product [Enterobius vermicularis]|uniref:Copine domain-containing protein n=1 Tax=Enterobius vermicularis TaxID=51028 RepID=A0A0N4VJ27_ENTVE|nr:unnamed protein product [Enterobius vermicularis]
MRFVRDTLTGVDALLSNSTVLRSSLELAVVVDFSSSQSTNVDSTFIEEVVLAIRTIGEQVNIYTKMADILRKRESVLPPQYFVVLILTRGYIDDLKETVQAIIFASRAPISIVFVGVGEGDFSEIERLGMAGCRLIYQNRRIDRDMMQFVNQTKLYNAEEQLDDVKDAINEAALSQIPWQMTKWMMRNGVKAEKSSFEEDDKEQQQSTPNTAPVTRRRISSVRYDSLMGTLSDSDEADRSPTTSVFSSSFFDKTFTFDYNAGVEELEIEPVLCCSKKEPAVR